MYTQDVKQYQGIREATVGAILASTPMPMTTRMPEVQREHEGLMAEIRIVSELLADLTQKLSPVRAEQPAQETANHSAGVHPVAPVTEIGQRIRAAQQEVGGLRRRVEALLSEVEV